MIGQIPRQIPQSGTGKITHERFLSRSPDSASGAGFWEAERVAAVLSEGPLWGRIPTFSVGTWRKLV